MIIWLPEKLYSYVKENREYTDCIKLLESSFLTDGEISRYADTEPYWNTVHNIDSITSQEKRNTYTQSKENLYNFLNELNLPLNLRLRLDIISLTDKSYLDKDSFDNLIKDIEEKIETLSDTSEKICCKIYLNEHKINYLIETLGVSYFDPIIYELRKECLRLYTSDTSYNYDESIHKIAYHTKANTFLKENIGSDLNKNWILFAYERLVNSLRFFEETSLGSASETSLDYMKNMLGYSKAEIYTNFYSCFISPFNDKLDSFVEIDEWFWQKFNTIEFKYSDFNFFKLKLLWYRFVANIGHSKYNKGIEILQLIYDMINSNLQNKIIMGKKLSYLSSGCYHIRFFSFISSIRKLERELLNDLDFYKNKNQFNTLFLGTYDEKLVDIEWKPEDNLDQANVNSEWNWSWLYSKIRG